MPCLEEEWLCGLHPPAPPPLDFCCRAGVAIVFLALYYKVLVGMGTKRPDKLKAADKALAHTSPHQLGKPAENLPGEAIA